jgi:D-3-phosphoglycerate dehydrogenase / 2-oxoglutarate reductase
MNMTADTTIDHTMEMLVLELLEWLDARERTYEEVMEAWHTSCPRFPVWEEVTGRGFVVHERLNGSEVIQLTSYGKAVLRKYRFLEIMRNYLKVVS